MSFTHHHVHGLREDQTSVRSFTQFHPRSKSRNLWRIDNWSECNSMDENYFVERQSRQVVNSKGICFICFGTLVLAKVMNIHNQCTSWEEKNGVVHEVSWIMRNGLYWCGFTTVFEWTILPGFTTLQLLEESSERWRRITFCVRSSKIDSYSCRCTSTSIWGKSRIQRNLFLEFLRCCCTRQKISWRTLVISRTRNWRTNGTERTSQKTKRFVEPCCWSVISTPTAHTFFSCALCQRACSSLLSQLFFRLQPSRHALIRVAQSTMWSFAYCVLPKNRHISSRNVIRCTSLEHYTYTWHMHSFLDTT